MRTAAPHSSRFTDAPRKGAVEPVRGRPATVCLEVSLLVVTAWTVLGLVAMPDARAQVVDPGWWIADGPVSTSALSGRTLYIGGSFGYVGPYTGASVLLDADAALVPGFPMVRGIVHAVVGDGSAGWFIGGSFDSVGGIPRRNLAHVWADHTVGAWNPGADRLVITLALSGDTVYAGGAFGNAGGQPRFHIAALSAGSGEALPWDPGANADVWALAVSGDRVFVGGDFTVIGGEARSYIAALDVSTGLATAWNPGANVFLNDLAVSGNIVYAAGAFTNIGGQARNFIAALDATTGLATEWDPNSNGQVLALAVDGNTVYVGGDFFHDSRLPPDTPSIGGQPRNQIAALDAATGLATAWSPYAPGRVRVIAVGGKTVFIGGDTVAEIDKVTGQPTAWDPGGIAIPTPPKVWALWLDTNTVYVGGEFASVGGRPRRSLAALDIDTGKATAWDPGVTVTGFPSTVVRALAVSGGTVYVGGDFSFEIGGQLRNRIAALDAETGLATPWNPNADNPVFALAATEGTVYAGGFFTSVGGQARSRIAALDAATGLATAWNPGASAPVVTLAVVGSTVYAGGSFTTIGGQARNRIAALDAATGQPTGWNPNASGTVFSLAENGGLIYAAGNFTAIGGQPRDRLAALSVTDGLATSWAPGADAIVRCLAVGAEAVYAGGDFSNAGGRACSRIAVLDAATGLARAWEGADNRVLTLAATSVSVFAGGEFTTIGGRPRSCLARIRDDFFTPTLISAFSATWRAGAIEITWSFADVSHITSAILERAPRAEGPWMGQAHEVRTDAAGTTAVDHDVEEGTTYWYRLVATDRFGAQIGFGPIAVTAGRSIREFSLGLPAPNPTTGAMRVEFELPRRSSVRLRLMDVQGREVARLLEGDRGAGHHVMRWDGRVRGGSLPAGIYFLRCETPGEARTARVVVAP